MCHIAIGEKRVRVAPVPLATKRANHAENLRILVPGRSIGASLDVTLELFVAIKQLALGVFLLENHY